MTTETQAILDAALALSDADRLMLVDRLLETLAPEQVELDEDEFFSALTRRSAVQN